MRICTVEGEWVTLFAAARSGEIGEFMRKGTYCDFSCIETGR